MPESFQELRSDYAAAKDSRFRRRRSGLGGTGDAHYGNESDFLRMREYVRDMDRNDAVIGQLVDRAVDNQIRGGFVLDPKTGDKGLDKELRAMWQEWAEDSDACDVAGERTFWDMERAVLRSTYIDGDVFVLPTEEGKLQLVEAERCRTPQRTKLNVVHGILLDAQRERLEYWFTKDVIDPLSRLARVSDVTKYPARDEDGWRQVFHVYNPKRITQTRGVTAFTPVLDISGMFEDVNFAKVVQQQMVSCFAGFLERTEHYKLGSESEQPEDDYTSSSVEDLSPGLLIKGKIGEKLNFPSANIPNAEYFQHVKLLLTLIGINIGMPLIMVLMDASETNFSGWRGAWSQAKLGFEANQKWLSCKFQRQVWWWRTRYLLSQGLLGAAAMKLGDRLYRVAVTAPKWDYIEPFKDAQADALQQEQGLNSRRRIQGERGRDVREIDREIINDNARLILRAERTRQKLEGKGIKGLSWKDLLNPFAAAAGSAKVQLTEDKEEPKNGNAAAGTASK